MIPNISITTTHGTSRYSIYTNTFFKRYLLDYIHCETVVYNRWLVNPKDTKEKLF